MRTNRLPAAITQSGRAISITLRPRSSPSDDHATANRLVDYLFRVQQKPDGSFPRNTWVDGRPIGEGGGLQLDQVALPLVLAYQLKRTDRDTWQKHIKPAADLIVQRGPKTDSDRWEEKSGYFHATVAAEIAGLVCAAEIASAQR